MNEQRYTKEEIKGILDIKDSRTLNRIIDAAGYPHDREEYGERELQWILKVKQIQKEKANMSYKDIKAEIERQKNSFTDPQLPQSNQTFTDPFPTTNNKSNSNDSSLDSLEEIIKKGVFQSVQTKVDAFVLSALSKVPSMMNDSAQRLSDEAFALLDRAEERNKYNMRQIYQNESREPILDGDLLEQYQELMEAEDDLEDIDLDDEDDDSIYENNPSPSEDD